MSTLSRKSLHDDESDILWHDKEGDLTQTQIGFTCSHRAVIRLPRQGNLTAVPISCNY